MQSVSEAVDEMKNSKSVQVLKCLRRMERLVLIGLYLKTVVVGFEKASFEEVMARC